MKHYKEFKQGYYKPIYPNKYIGRNLPKYLSSYELKFFLWCDRNSNVLKWASESVVIPYISPVDNKLHKYYVDNIVHIKEGNQVKRYLIEIKPQCQTIPPTVSKRKKDTTILYEQATYAVNQAKWDAAKRYCEKLTSYGESIQFIILTEKELNIT